MRIKKKTLLISSISLIGLLFIVLFIKHRNEQGAYIPDDSEYSQSPAEIAYQNAHASHSVDPNAISSSTTPGMNVFTNKYMNYSMHYPATYELSEDSLHDIYIDATGETAMYAQSGCLISATSTQSTSVTDIPQILADQQSERNKALGIVYPIHYIYTVKEKVVVDHEPAVIVVPAGVSSQGTEVYPDGIELAVIHKGLLYTMTGDCTVPEFYKGLLFLK